MVVIAAVIMAGETVTPQIQPPPIALPVAPMPEVRLSDQPWGTLLRPMRHSLGAQQLCGLQCEPLPGY